MALTDKLTAIANAIRSKTGKSDALTLEQMPGEIEGIQTGGGGAELIYETTFSLAESQIDVGNVTIAVISTGLTEADWAGTHSLRVVIECINDTEEDWSAAHWIASVGEIGCSDGYDTHFSPPYHIRDLGKGKGPGFGYFFQAGAFVKSATKWAETITINTNSAYKGGWGFVPSGDYSVRIYRDSYTAYGLESGNG